MTQRKPTALWNRSTGLLTTHTNPQFSLISAQSPLLLGKSSASIFQRRTRYKFHSNKLDRKGRKLHRLKRQAIFTEAPQTEWGEPFDFRSHRSRTNYPFRLFLIYDKNRQTISFIMVRVFSIICHVFC